jgi:4-amino-4-deoxy-L-arabinose transferase-like glycosyltransferase
MRLPSWPVLLAWAAVLILAIALLDRLMLFASHSLLLISFPWQVDFDEGIILHSSWLLAEGRNPYPANDPQLFVSSVYPPLYYALNAIALKIWGLNLWSGRALSVLGTLFVWTAAETRSRAAGLLAGGFWLVLGPVIVWASFYKQDILALGFGVAGCAMIAAGYPEDAPAAQRRWLGAPRLVWLAIVPLLLAFWTKQSAVAPLAAAGLYLLLRDWRLGLRWGVVAAAALIVPFFALNFVLQGQLYQHLNVSNDYELSACNAT